MKSNKNSKKLDDRENTKPSSQTPTTSSTFAIRERTPEENEWSEKIAKGVAAALNPSRSTPPPGGWDHNLPGKAKMPELMGERSLPEPQHSRVVQEFLNSLAESNRKEAIERAERESRRAKHGE